MISRWRSLTGLLSRFGATTLRRWFEIASPRAFFFPRRQADALASEECRFYRDAVVAHRVESLPRFCRFSRVESEHTGNTPERIYRHTVCGVRSSDSDKHVGAGARITLRVLSLPLLGRHDLPCFIDAVSNDLPISRATRQESAGPSTPAVARAK